MMTVAPTRTRTELVARHVHTRGRGAGAKIDEAGWGRGGASRRMAETESHIDTCDWIRRGRRQRSSSRTRTVEARGHSVTRQGQRGRGDDDERRWDSGEEKRHGGAAGSGRDEGAERLHTQGGKRRSRRWAKETDRGRRMAPLREWPRATVTRAAAAAVVMGDEDEE